MGLWLTLSLISVFSLALAENGAVELTDSNFKSLIGEYDTALVMFYAPWCGHCKRLKPEFDKAGGILKNSDPPIILAKVDCTEGGKDTCNQFSVTGYPTLKIFRNGEVSQDYNGPREAAGIVKFMTAQVGPSSKELNSASELDTFIDKDDVAVVGCFEKDSELKTAYLKLADKLREKVRFGHSSQQEVLKKLGSNNGVVLIRPKHLQNKFEPNTVTYTDSASKDDIEDFIKKNFHGLVGHRQRDNANEFVNPQVLAYYTVDYVKNPKGTNYWRNRILKVAKQFAEDFTFSVSAKDDFQHELNEFGLDFVPPDKPVVFARNANGQKFAMKDEFSIDNLEKFINDVKAGNLEPFLKSEPIPEDNSFPVKVAVGKNFDELVTDSGRDALIEFYAPWCGHCKKLGPIYDELAEKLKDEEVDIVKLDATANDVPSLYDVKGFPTLYWSPKNAKSTPRRYEGGREVDDFLQYIAKQSTDGLKGFDRNGKPKNEEL